MAAEEEGEGRAAVAVERRRQADLFQHGDGDVLRLVADEHRRAARLGEFAELTADAGARDAADGGAPVRNNASGKVSRNFPGSLAVGCRAWGPRCGRTARPRKAGIVRLRGGDVKDSLAPGPQRDRDAGAMRHAVALACSDIGGRNLPHAARLRQSRPGCVGLLGHRGSQLVPAEELEGNLLVALACSDIGGRN